MRKLSTLEMTVIGLAWLRGPCTIYALMKELSLSASSFHKSRAGTAYSVANRLLEFGLLELADQEETADERLVRISESGKIALQEWLASPVPMADVAHSADLIRLRFFFIGAISVEERLAFIDSSILGLEAFLHECVALVPKNEEIGDYFGVLATLSAIYETKARIEWLKVVRKWVVHPITDQGHWSETTLAEVLDSLKVKRQQPKPF